MHSADPLDHHATLPIVLTSTGPVPLYLQIKYQISYLITSGQLVAGDKLPPVRTVAGALEVNPGTVALAYRELQQDGLIDATVGRGTFVAPTFPLARDAAVRQREATTVIDGALNRLRALGLTDGDIRLRFESLLAAKPFERHVLLASPTDPIGVKYAASLNRSLGPTVTIHKVTYADIEERAPHVSALLDLCYFVVTFASSVRRIELALEPFAKPFRLLGITTKLMPATIAFLADLAPGSQAVILSEERYAHQSLGLVLKHSPLAAADVELVTLEEAEKQQAAKGTGEDLPSGSTRQVVAGSRLLLHTFGARAAAADLATHAFRHELSFDIVPESVARLRSILVPGEGGKTATPTAPEL